MSRALFFILLSSPLLLFQSTNASPTEPVPVKCKYCLTLGEDKETKEECKDNFKLLKENVQDRTGLGLDNLELSGAPDTCFKLSTMIDISHGNVAHKHSLTLRGGVNMDKGALVGHLHGTPFNLTLERKEHPNGETFTVEAVGCKTDYCNGHGKLLPSILPVLTLGLCLKYLISV